MAALQGLYTSESVSDGHPDKICDQISDRIVDRFLALDKNARVACETLIADQRVIVVGEFASRQQRQVEVIRQQVDTMVRDTLRHIGYGDARFDIDPDRCRVEADFNVQSSDIARGVDIGDGILGAGDQGVMVGHASNDSAELLPLPIALAHRLIRRLAKVRRMPQGSFLRPDAKAQVSVSYRDGVLPAIEAIVVSTQHRADVSLESVREAIRDEVIAPVIAGLATSNNLHIAVNPAGAFVTGGPKGDTGLTGRKIVADSYGSACAHGGGAFSGKDPTKVDRSGAYMARYLAKHVVASGIASRCTVQLAYAIGVPEPLALNVDVHGAEGVDEPSLARALASIFDLTPAGIICELQLDRPIYANTAAFGHFGRNGPEFTWEQVGRVPEVVAAARSMRAIA